MCCMGDRCATCRRSRTRMRWSTSATGQSSTARRRWNRRESPCGAKGLCGATIWVFLRQAHSTRRPPMSLRIGDEAPNFQVQTTQGPIDFHQWIGYGYAVLFSHPKDFTPVCATELGYMARIKPEFDKRNTKIIGLSVDPVDDHERWAKDIEETQGTAPKDRKSVV